MQSPALALLGLALVSPLAARPTPASSDASSAAYALLELPHAAVALEVDDDDDTVRDFRRYFRRYEDTATRVEAILALEGIESTKVVDALVPILKHEEFEVVRAAVSILAAFETDEPIAHIWETIDDKRDEPTRVGLLWAIADGGYGGDPEVFEELLEDRSWEVRRRAANAVVSSGLENAAAMVAPLCADGETAVRCAALEGLAVLRSELVVEPAIASLEHEVWQVRASATLALGRVRSRDAIGPLIARMQVEEGRLVADIGEALANITGRDFGQRVEGWVGFWEQWGDRFEIPSDEDLARLRAAQAERREFYNPPGSVSYHGISTPSRSILFVIDVSGSMENEVIERERFEDGEYPSYQRIDIVKTELARTIENLEPYVKFNVFAFATEIEQWKGRLVSANVLNKSSAMEWVGRLEALGGPSREDLAGAGLAGSANLEAGKTNTYGALMEALGVAGQGLKDEHYEVGVDTIFFLSDGRPSHGRYVDVHDILREVRTANDLRKVVIHTIALGEFQKSFMRMLAEQNGGTFVDLGR